MRKIIQTIINETNKGVEKKYNKHLLSAMAYMGIGCTLIFGYFVKIETGLLIIGIILILISGLIYKTFKYY